MFKCFAASAALFGAALIAGPSHAVMVTKTFEAEVMYGSSKFIGTVGEGSFIYDDALVSSSGLDFLTAADGIEIYLDIFGQSFSHEDDADFPFYPEIVFLNGAPVGLDFIISEPFTLIDEPGVTSIAMGSLVEWVPPPPGPLEALAPAVVPFDFTLSVDIPAVPTPAALPLLAAALAIGGFAARGRKSA